MHDIDRLITALLESIEERLRNLDNKIAKNVEESDLYRANERKIAENRKEWSKLGFLSVTLGKHKNILAAQSEALMTRYTMRTRLQGFRFARVLTQRLIQELTVLSRDISLAKRTLGDAATRFKSALVQQASERRREGPEQADDSGVRPGRSPQI